MLRVNTPSIRLEPSAIQYPVEITSQNLAVHASDNMLLFTAVLSVFIGGALIWMGRKGKIMWMWTWGAGLIIMSIYMAVAILFNA